MSNGWFPEDASSPHSDLLDPKKDFDAVLYSPHASYDVFASESTLIGRSDDATIHISVSLGLFLGGPSNNH